MIVIPIIRIFSAIQWKVPENDLTFFFVKIVFAMASSHTSSIVMKHLDNHIFRDAQ